MKLKLSAGPVGLIVPAVLLLLLAGCRSAFMYTKGVRKPSVQTEESVKAFLKKHQVPAYDGSFVLPDTTSALQFFTAIPTTLSVTFFTPEGYLIKVHDSGYCAGKSWNFATGLKAGDAVQVDSSLYLGDLMPRLKPLFPLPDSMPEKTDVILLGSWATFFGKVNQNVFGVTEAAAANPRIKARIYLVNVDQLDTWGVSEPFIRFAP